MLDRDGWTDEEIRVKRPFLAFWIPVLFFLSVWVFSMALLDFLRFLRD